MTVKIIGHFPDAKSEKNVRKTRFKCPHLKQTPDLSPTLLSSRPSHKISPFSLSEYLRKDGDNRERKKREREEGLPISLGVKEH